MQLTSPANPTFFLRDTTESDRKRKRAQEDKYKMGEGENKKEEGTMKDGDGREPEAKKKKQSKIDTSSDSDDDEDDEDDDDEASVQMCCSSDAAAVCHSLSCFFSFHRRKAKAERNTQKWTKRCAGWESTNNSFDPAVKVQVKNV